MTLTLSLRCTTWNYGISRKPRPILRVLASTLLRHPSKYIKSTDNIHHEIGNRVSLSNISRCNTVYWPTFGDSTQQTFTCSKPKIDILEKRCEVCSKLTIKTTEWQNELLTLKIFRFFKVSTFLIRNERKRSIEWLLLKCSWPLKRQSWYHIETSQFTFRKSIEVLSVK